ncbi:MAG TPA: cation:proton antiporter [Thermoplasmata archaeon]|nr:cation:proton antiporter [Thermoplasmata archaeon]
MALLALTGTSLALMLIGLALLLGFAADFLAERLRVPDALWLMALGVLVGPILGLVTHTEVLTVAPALGTAVLVVILFDAGLDMRSRLIRPFLGSTVAFAAGTVAAGGALLYVAGYWVLFPGHVALSLYFATALAATSGAIAIPIANRMGLVPPLRGFIHLEAALEDAFVIVAATFILLVVTPGVNISSLELLLAFTLPVPVGIAVGVAAAFLWLFVFSRWQHRQYAALATLGYVLAVYGVAAVFHGSGILAALVLGIVIANSYSLRRFIPWIRPFEMRPGVRAVQTEVAFLLRALFLFLLGTLVLLVSPGLVTLVTIGVLSVGVLAVRYGLAGALGRARRIPSNWAATLGGIGGRGLTSAVLLVLPLGVLPGADGLFLPGVILIFGTDIAMTIWLASLGRRTPTAGPAPGEELYASLASQLPLLERLALDDSGSMGSHPDFPADADFESANSADRPR